MVDGKEILVGNELWLAENGVRGVEAADDEGFTTLHVAVAGRPAGRVRFAEAVRPGARQTIERLRARGVRRVVMLTGDNRAAAARIARELGVDEVEAELLPEGKVTAIRRLRAEGHKVAMVGDGVNDAPALAAADVGIAMGVRGTQAAIEASDVALMTDDISKIALARAIAGRAYRTIQENLFVGVGVVHVTGIAAVLGGMIGPIQAALIHLGPDILVFLNSIKLLRVDIERADV